MSVCGDEEGNSTAVFENAVSKRGLHLESAFTLVMPNNYIFGFDVDPKELEFKKLQNAKQRLQQINAILAQRQKGASEN